MISNKQMLWWGRFDPAYSRNGVLRQHLAALGWSVTDFFPRSCPFGDLEAALRRLPKPDAVWVPSFRQRDVAAARRWCDRKGVPLIFDPLISSYDKQVFERFKLAEGSGAAQRLLAQERRLFAQADLVLADTACHADFFAQTLGVARAKLRVVLVGADETLFKAAPSREQEGPLEALFYGSFIPLHGAPTIVEAARVYQGPPVRWCLLCDCRCGAVPRDLRAPRSVCSTARPDPARKYFAGGVRHHAKGRARDPEQSVSGAGFRTSGDHARLSGVPTGGAGLDSHRLRTARRPAGAGGGRRGLGVAPRNAGRTRTGCTYALRSLLFGCGGPTPARAKPRDAWPVARLVLTLKEPRDTF